MASPRRLELRSLEPGSSVLPAKLGRNMAGPRGNAPRPLVLETSVLLLSPRAYGRAVPDVAGPSHASPLESNECPHGNVWSRRWESNPRSLGYEPSELPLLHSAVSCALAWRTRGRSVSGGTHSTAAPSDTDRDATRRWGPCRRTRLHRPRESRGTGPRRAWS